MLWNEDTDVEAEPTRGFRQYTVILERVGLASRGRFQGGERGAYNVMKE